MQIPEAATLAGALAAAAGRRPGPVIHLLGSDLQPRPLPAAELLEMARDAAAGLLDRGIAPGARVFLVLPTGEDFLATFFGCVLAGIVPCPLSPPQAAQSPALFRARVAELGRHLGIRAVVAAPEIAAELAAAEGGLPALTPGCLRGSGGHAALPPPRPGDPAFLQLTSGSTSLPKGVAISHRALLANLRQIAGAAGIRAGDVMVSWLPLFHDMGLVSGLILPLVHEMDLVLSNPFGFLRRPVHWLQAIQRFGGTHSPAPVFAYRQLADRAADRDLAGLDLGSWRVAFVGAEPIQPEVLARCEERLGPRGLSATALTPCYGMAEATLAITVKPAGQRFRLRPASRGALAREARLEPPAGGGDEVLLVSSGQAVEGTRVTVHGEDGRELPEGWVGEVVVRGPSLFDGYVGLAEPAPEAIAAGFHTGDLGFLADGELFITGRRKELIILSGENHHPAEVEWAAGRVAGVRAGRIAAFGVSEAAMATELLCVMAESARDRDRGRPGVAAAGDGGEGRGGGEDGPGGDQRGSRDDLAAAIRRSVREETGLVVSHVEIVPQGTLPVTTSGKLRRAGAREIFLGRREARQHGVAGLPAQGSAGPRADGTAGEPVGGGHEKAPAGGPAGNQDQA
jgi:acyl-CoA synthetase (AMP-forming)/AMP-acid ligase II